MIITYLKLFSHPADRTVNKKKRTPAVIPCHSNALSAFLNHVKPPPHTSGTPFSLSGAHAYSTPAFIPLYRITLLKSI